MAKRSEFVDYILEQLAPLGEVTARSMFGGYGIYLDGRMFALVADDTLYVKVDDGNRAEFEREGLQPFRYARTDSEVAVMSYYQPPGAAIDDREALCAWAQKGVEAATRAAAKPRRRKK
ncbi:MAG: TfoX/Sxy family protein [Chthoniobacteraceae bacterium]